MTTCACERPRTCKSPRGYDYWVSLNASSLPYLPKTVYPLIGPTLAYIGHNRFLDCFLHGFLSTTSSSLNHSLTRGIARAMERVWPLEARIAGGHQPRMASEMPISWKKCEVLGRRIVGIIFFIYVSWLLALN